MSSPATPDIMTGTPTGVRPGAVPARRSYDRRDPWPRLEPDGDTAHLLAGQPDHGEAALLRRRPVHLVDGRVEGRCTSAYEFICASCGDDPDLDFLEVSPRLQWLRGPWTLAASPAAYDERLSSF